MNRARLRGDRNVRGLITKQRASGFRRRKRLHSPRGEYVFRGLCIYEEEGRYKGTNLCLTLTSKGCVWQPEGSEGE